MIKDPSVKVKKSTGQSDDQLQEACALLQKVKPFALLKHFGLALGPPDPSVLLLRTTPGPPSEVFLFRPQLLQVWMGSRGNPLGFTGSCGPGTKDWARDGWRAVETVY